MLTLHSIALNGRARYRLEMLFETVAREIHRLPETLVIQSVVLNGKAGCNVKTLSLIIALRISQEPETRVLHLSLMRCTGSLKC